MGACPICGQNAGLFSSVHRKCEEARISALTSIRQGARDALIGEALALSDDKLRQMKLNRKDMEPFRRDLPRISGFWNRCSDLMTQGHLSRGLCHDAVVDGWLDAARLILADTMMDKWELAAVKAGDAEFGLSSSEERLMEARSLMKLATVRAQITFEDSGEIEEVPFDVIPVRGERIFWTYGPSTYCKQVSVSAHGGGFAGASVRAAPGVYVRGGGYQGESQSAPRFQPHASGTVAMSNLQTWFKSGPEIARIPHASLIATQAFIDGFALTPSTGSPVLFSLPESAMFPGFLGGILAGLAKDFAADVR